MYSTGIKTVINPTKHYTGAFMDKAVTLLLDNKASQLVFAFPPTTVTYTELPVWRELLHAFRRSALLSV